MIRRLSLAGFVLVICAGSVFAQTQVRLKLADGSYMSVDDAWESPQGVWYRRNGLNNILPKDKVKKIERIDPQAPTVRAPANDDDHFDASDVIAQPAPTNSGTFDGPTWIFLKGGARVEADSASQSPAGVWYKRSGMSIFIDAVRVDRVELEETATAVTSSTKKERGWSTGRLGIDNLIHQNRSKYNVDPYLIFLVMEQESPFNAHAV